jgi:hypothetical protein
VEVVPCIWRDELGGDYGLTSKGNHTVVVDKRYTLVPECSDEIY